MVSKKTSAAMVIVGAEIRRRRSARGLGLRELGAAASVDFGYLGKIERGQPAAIGTYARIATALGTSLPALLTQKRTPRRAA